jgi:hypothetical protein
MILLRTRAYVPMCIYLYGPLHHFTFICAHLQYHGTNGSYLHACMLIYMYMLLDLCTYVPDADLHSHTDIHIH